MTSRGMARWSLSLVVVLLLHGLAILLVWTWPAPPVAVTRAPPEGLAVELAPVPESPPAPPREVPPGPPRQEQHRQAPKVEKKITMKTVERADAELPKPVDTPQASKDDTATANVEQTQAPPSVKAEASQRYAAATTNAGQRSAATATWQGALLAHLERYRRYPRQAERLHQQGVSYVRFAVDRQGHVSAIQLDRSSSFELLDRETLDTVSRANPVPPPPPEIDGDPVDVVVPVAFFLRR